MTQKKFQLAEIVSSLGLTIVYGAKDLRHQVLGGYASDLLSDVMTHAHSGDVWLTLQTHPNIIAVAVLKDIAAVILVNGRKPETDTIEKAKHEGIPILSTNLSTFETAGKLYAMGLTGTR